ncbi:ribosome recycling factor [Candidatus Dependentiae bacterium]|nr:ribosome recycling factor [Candidatus Dependentiae bacterium]MBU4387126.1 ribosome recycling factor [Candidatus Dependentiae bacterium]
MENPVKHYERELAAIRTGRASTKLVEDVKVEVYGQQMRIKDLASISTPDARLITIQPWDKTVIIDIEKGIAASDLGVTPVNDGNLIRIQLPQMTESRRTELEKILGKKTEECKIGIRNIRKEFHNSIRESEKEKDISQDFAKRLSDLLQKITDQYTAKVDEMNDKKLKEIKLV